MKSCQQIYAEFRARVDSMPDDKKKLEEILEFSLNYGDSYSDQMKPLMEEGVALSRRIDFELGEILCYFNTLFFGGLTKGSAFAEIEESFSKDPMAVVRKLEKEPYWYSLGLNQLSFYYWFHGEYEKGFNLAFEAVRRGEGSDDKNVGWNYFSLGVFFFDIRDFDNSDLYYGKAYEWFERYEVEYGVARAGNGLASVALMRNELQKARPLLLQAAQSYRNLSHYSGLSRALNDLGVLQRGLKQYDEAEKILGEAIKLRQEINHVQGLITTYTEVAELYIEKKQYPEALKNLFIALDLSEKAKSRQKTMRLHKLLYDVYKSLGDTYKALEHFEKFYDLRTNLMGDEATNNIKRLQTKFEKEKSEQEAEIERLKNVELKKAYEIIEQKNKDIHDSINYASRIQRSLLPSERNVHKMLQNLRNKSS